MTKTGTFIFQRFTFFFALMLLFIVGTVFGESDGSGFGGGVRLFMRAPLMKTDDVFSSSLLFEPYVTYNLNPQAAINLAFGYTGYDREPVNTGIYATGEKVSGSDTSVSIITHGGTGFVRMSLGFGNIWRNHEESYTVNGSNPSELDFDESSSSFVGIVGMQFIPVQYTSIGTQLRYHNSSDFWICLGIGYGY